MAFERKTYSNRNSEYPGRRRLTPTGEENVFDTQREEGLVYDEGVPYSADTMNSLEGRVEAAVAGADAAAGAAQTRADAAYNLANTANNTANAKAPTAHAVNASTYGLGSANVYGHVKVSDTYTYNPGNAAQGVAASGQAVYVAYDRANSAYNLANTAYSRADNAYSRADSAYNRADKAFDQALVATNIGHEAVKLSGDQDIRGNKRFYNTVKIGGSSSGAILNGSTKGLEIKSYWSNGTAVGVYGIYVDGEVLYCDSPYASLGGGNYPWNVVYCRYVEQSSDARLKEDLIPIDSAMASQLVKSLQGKSYRMKSDHSRAKSFGFVAQEVIEAFAEQGIDIGDNQYRLVSKGDDEDDMYGMSYTDFIPILSEALKESLHTQDRMETELATLREEVNELKAALQAR